MISQRDLSLISNDLLKNHGGRRIPDQTIELDYVLGWFLSEASQHKFGEHLAFKGGTALRRCYFGEYRFSEDLDFTLLNDASFDEVTTAFNEIGEAVHNNAPAVQHKIILDRKRTLFSNRNAFFDASRYRCQSR